MQQTTFNNLGESYMYIILVLELFWKIENLQNIWKNKRKNWFGFLTLIFFKNGITKYWVRLNFFFNRQKVTGFLQQYIYTVMISEVTL